MEIAHERNSFKFSSADFLCYLFPGAEKGYQFDQSSGFDEAVLTPTSLQTGSPIAAELMTMINNRAIATKDVPVEDGEPVSFFETAVPAS